uniref:Sugar phosphate transporter domain-containing protein n=1 Tax=Alexandrium monilatum TaxID=311494 RepID=A0A7S4Q9H7_9DINO
MGRLDTVALLAIGSLMMALKPLLLHLTREVDGAVMPPEQFQLAAEVVKLLSCGLALAGRRVLGMPAPLWRGVRHSAPFAIPAAVYLLMNVLTVRAARLLAPPVFQLVANLKIICTAVASWALLSRRLVPAQWLALVLLTAGVALGQWPGAGSAEGQGSPSALGVLLMAANSCLSAMGGVLTEKLLKGAVSSELSIFATNVHMAAHTLLVNCLALGAQGLVWSPAWPSARVAVALANEAVNGILISVLMRRLDSIAKNFAFSASVFLTAGLSASLLNYRPPLQFFMGATLATLAVLLFARPGNPKGKRQ